MMSSTSPDTETSCSKKTVVLSILCIPFIPIIFFLGAFLVGPYLYFELLMKRDLNEMYLAKGIRLSGSVLEQWTTTSIVENSGPTTSFNVKVLYEAPGGGMYVKNFEVTEDKQSLTNIQLIILPQYPASAIQYSTIDPLEKWMPFDTEKWFTIDTRQLYIVILSFLWTFVYNISLTSYGLSNVSLLNIWAIAIILACEVCISFVIGFFLNFSMTHDDEVQIGSRMGFHRGTQNIPVQNIMFEATPYDKSSRNVPQPVRRCHELPTKRYFHMGATPFPVFCSPL